MPDKMRKPKDQWFEKNLGHEITVEGKAMNAHEGALLEMSEGWLWIDALDGWPEGYYLGGEKGKRVRVKGIVIKRYDLPVFEEKPGSPAIHGIPVPPGTGLHEAKKRYLLQNATWQLVQ